MRNVSKLVLSGLFALLMGVGACDKKADDGAKGESSMAAEAKPEAKPANGGGGGGGAAAATAAKPTKEDCEKLAQHQIDIETDAQMKSALKASMQGLIDQCMQLNKAQLDCMMGAKDGPGFADCMMKNR
jgi:hypothetical protein